MISPYPLGFTMGLPWYYLRPCTRNRCGLQPLPLTAGRARAGPALRLVFGGDVMAPSRWRPAVVHPELARVTQSADLVVLNCEGPVCDHVRWRRRLVRERLTRSWLETLLEQLVSTPQRCVLSVANNHAGDWGVRGLTETLQHLQRIGVIPLGQRNGSSEPVTTLEINGFRIGLAAWTHWINRSVFAPGKGVWRWQDVAGRQWPAIRKRAALDLLVATPHWEYEFRHFPVRATREGATRLAAWGFDIVAGHHPHVVQPMERIGNTLCLYSSGNLSGPAMPVPWPACLGLLLEVELGTQVADQRLSVAYRVHPYVQLPGKHGFSLVPIDHAPPALGQRLACRLSALFSS